jgi:hypothetical protein
MYLVLIGFVDNKTGKRKLYLGDKPFFSIRFFMYKFAGCFLKNFTQRLKCLTFL